MADNIPDPDSPSDREEVLWEHLRAYIQTPPPEARRDGFWKSSVEFDSIAPIPFPPASEEQLRETEAELGFALPSELRRFYAEIANGGRYISPIDILHGAVGGCPLYDESGHDTIGQLVSHSGWRLHPRIEEALLRHPGRHILADADALPEGFLFLGLEKEGYNITAELDRFTGRVYREEYGFSVTTSTSEERPVHSLKVAAPSLGVWFARWLEERIGYSPGEPWPKVEYGPLTADLVEVADLPDPEVVWQGLYRFGPDGWLQPPDEAD